MCCFTSSSTRLRMKRSGDNVTGAEADWAAGGFPLRLKKQKPTFPARSTTRSSISGWQQDARYDTSITFSLAASTVVFIVPLPWLRLTRSTPEPSAPSLTRTARFHVDEEQLAEHAADEEQFTEQLDCRLVC